MLWVYSVFLKQSSSDQEPVFYDRNVRQLLNVEVLVKKFQLSLTTTSLTFGLVTF